MSSEPLCVYCKKRSVDHRWRPFCSERCKVLDLATWADGGYRVAGEPVESPPADEPHADPNRKD